MTALVMVTITVILTMMTMSPDPLIAGLWTCLHLPRQHAGPKHGRTEKREFVLVSRAPGSKDRVLGFASGTAGLPNSQMMMIIVMMIGMVMVMVMTMIIMMMMMMMMEMMIVVMNTALMTGLVMTTHDCKHCKGLTEKKVPTLSPGLSDLQNA